MVRDAPRAIWNTRLARGRCGRSIREPRATAAVPILFHSVASRRITVDRRHVPEQATVGAVAQQMAPDLHAVARFDVLLLDADPCEPRVARCLQRPDCGFALIVPDFDVEPGM